MSDHINLFRKNCNSDQKEYTLLELYNMANKKQTTHVSSAPIRLTVHKITYQIPHPLLLFLQSINAMVNR